jgi:hypothetical protein
VRFAVYRRVARLDFARIDRAFYSPNYYGVFLQLGQLLGPAHPLFILFDLILLHQHHLARLDPIEGLQAHDIDPA